MKYVMLAILSVLYMSSVAYGSNGLPCGKKKVANAFSSAGRLTAPDATTTTSDGSR